MALLAAHRDRAGVDHALDAGQPAGFEAVVHAEDVEPHDLVGIALAGAEAVGEVDDALGLEFQHGAHDVLELRDVAAHDRRADRGAVEGDRTRIQVHTHHRLAARDQLADQAGADESRRAEHEHRHGGLPKLPG